MPSDLFHINIHEVTSFETILSELDELNKNFSRNRLNQFRVFNKAYFIITKAIKTASEDHYFKNPIFIEKFTVCFAHYYFQAINETVSNNAKLPVAWTMTNRAAQNKATPNFIYLLMGANAHINHDLPLALLELMDQKKADDLLKDVLKIDKLLMKSGREILGVFAESNKLLDFLKRRFVFVYYRPLMYMILWWRIKAWRNYRSIKKNGLKASGYAKYSINTAKRFLKLAKWVR